MRWCRRSVVVLLVSIVIATGSARSEDCRFFELLSLSGSDSDWPPGAPEEGHPHPLPFDAWLPRWAQRAIARDPDIQETFRLIREWNGAVAAEDEERAVPMDLTYATIALRRQRLILVMVHHPITCPSAGCSAYVYLRAGATGRQVGDLRGRAIMVEVERRRGSPVLSADDGHELCLYRWDGRRFHHDDCDTPSRGIYADAVGDVCTQLRREDQQEGDRRE